jgi:oxaloacetate decarboxylase beta subunit
MEALSSFFESTGIAQLANDNWLMLVMLVISCVLLYLGIVKKFEPLLLIPIGFGMLLANLPGANLMAEPVYNSAGELKQAGGLIYYLYQGVKLGIYPSLIFIGVGAMTDFGPLIANPKSMLLGAAAQLGIFAAYLLAMATGIFTQAQAAAIGIIGGADGPTAIYSASRLAPELLGAIAIAAYSYMALVPVIQPPIMKLLTTKKERMIVMQQLREVSKTEKNVFPVVVTIIVSLILPSAAPLIGALN